MRTLITNLTVNNSHAIVLINKAIVIENSLMKNVSFD